MTATASARPSFRETQTPDNRFMSTRLIVALTLLLGVAFTASALVGSPSGAANAPMQLSAADEGRNRAAIADPSAVQDPAVTEAVSHWTAETAAKQRPAQGTYDWQELWLPR